MIATVVGFSPASEYDSLEQLREYQRGRCATCGQRRPLVVDHDHGTGLVRGLLCYACNAQEGRRGDRSFDTYRRNPPAALLGLAIEYEVRLGETPPQSYDSWRASQAHITRIKVQCAHRAGALKRTKRALALAAVLAASRDGDRHHSYDLRNASGVRAGSLYNLLNRMMAVGWLTDGWEDPAITRQQKRPPRRYYTVTPAGRAALTELLKEQ